MGVRVILDTESAVQATLLLLCVGTLIHACECLVTASDFGHRGFYSWDVLRTFHPAILRRSSFDRMALISMSVRSVRAALAVQIVGVCWILWSLRYNDLDRAKGLFTASAIVTCVLALLHYRNMAGFDGSDQMRFLIWIALTCYFAAVSPTVKVVCLCFIAAQAILSYSTAGIAKAISPIWRKGEAVGAILRTETYGAPWVSRAVDRFHLSKPLSWATIGFECGAILLIAFGPPGALVFIALGLFFHLGIAVTMGLNGFFWSFSATYPALLAISQYSPLG
jgi:hypothetical protein